MKFIEQTGHNQSVMTHINEDRNRRGYLMTNDEKIN